jgi:pimeloyl-ACP methyl ester carboxylesterase
MVAKPQTAWMSVDWSQHQRWVWVDGAPANVIEIGSGPPLVFVHGLSGSWQNWLCQLPAFAETHRCIAIDLPGFGESPMPPDGKITIKGYGKWLATLLDELDVEACALVGNSMGGFIGLEAAISYPERVERLVLVSAAGLSIEHARNEPVLKFLELTQTVAQHLLIRSMPISRRLARHPRGRKPLLWFVVAHPEKLHPALALEQIKGSGKPGFVPALDALTDYPIRDRLDDIGCPTLIVWGDEDRLVPVRDAYDFDKLIPDSRLIVHKDVGHVAMLEVPDRFNSDLAGFLAEQPSGRDERVAAAAD